MKKNENWILKLSFGNGFNIGEKKKKRSINGYSNKNKFLRGIKNSKKGDGIYERIRF